jgi:hypothetical protein
MKKFIGNFNNSKLGRGLARLNQHDFMPAVWWTVLALILWLSFPLFRIKKVIRLGLLFLLFNGWLSFHLGQLIRKRNLASWWGLLLPAVFALTVLLHHFAMYNYVLCLLYLLLELLGSWRGHFYKERK